MCLDFHVVCTRHFSRSLTVLLTTTTTSAHRRWNVGGAPAKTPQRFTYLYVLLQAASRWKERRQKLGPAWCKGRNVRLEAFSGDPLGDPLPGKDSKEWEWVWCGFFFFALFVMLAVGFEGDVVVFIVVKFFHIQEDKRTLCQCCKLLVQAHVFDDGSCFSFY